MTPYEQRKTIEFLADDVNIDSGSDTHEWVPGQKVELLRVGFIVTTDVANAAGNVDVQVFKRTEAGDNSTNSEIVTVRLTDTTTVANGQVLVYEFGSPSDTDGTATSGAPGIGGEVVYDADPDLPEIDVGESVLFNVENAADSGVVVAFLEVLEKPFPKASEDSDVTLMTSV